MFEKQNNYSGFMIYPFIFTILKYKLDVNYNPI